MRNNLFVKILAVVLVALGSIACTKKTSAPLYTVTDSPITTATGRPATLEQVQTAIIRAGAQSGWQMRVDKPGLVIGTLMGSNYQAVIKIPYSTKSYSIQYENSQGLNAEGGLIHKRYNGWVQRLDAGIRSQLSAL